MPHNLNHNINFLILSRSNDYGKSAVLP